MRLTKPSHHFFYIISLAIISCLFSSYALASSYQVFPYIGSSAVEEGDAGAGGAAIAHDASTAFSNPAGLTRILNQQLIIAGSGLFTHVKFSGSNTWNTSALPTPLNTYTQSGTADGSGSIFIPALYYAAPLNDKWSFGFSVTGPFGLGTFYNNASVLRYSGTKNQLKVIDVSPDLAYKFNEQFSFGAGLDFDYFDLIFRAMAGIPTFPVGIPPTQNDALSRNQMNAWGVSWHAGILYQLKPTTRFGFAYHARVKGNLNGKSTFEGGLVSNIYGLGELTLNSLKTTWILPPVSSLSAYHEFNSQWAMDGTLSYTQWSSIAGNQVVQNVAVTPPTTPTTVIFPQHYRDTWMIALGGIYQATPKWLLRAGIGFDQSPIQSSERNVALPDGNRVLLAVGTHYQASKKLGFDAGYTHVFMQKISVNFPTVVATQTSTANGNFRNGADILGIQMTWDFV